MFIVGHCCEWSQNPCIYPHPANTNRDSEGKGRLYQVSFLNCLMLRVTIGKMEHLSILKGLLTMVANLMLTVVVNLLLTVVVSLL